MDTQTNKEPAAEVLTEPGTPDTGAEGQADGNKGMEAHEDVVVTENEKAYEAALRRILGLKDDEQLDSLDERISQLEKSAADKLAAAKNQVISAELRALQGYDTKLLDRLLDRSKLTVDDSGRVTSLEEAVKAIAAEFPAVVLKEKKPFVPIGSGTGTAAKPTMNDLIRGKR